MTRFLLLGDTHNDLSHARIAIRAAVKAECHFIIQLGDWGFTWPMVGQWRDLDESLHEADMRMMFIDGNHDCYSDLKQRGIWRADHLCPMTGNITYIPRGVAFEFDGISFMGLGGAVSIDRGHRIEGASWWPEEAITERDIAKAFEVEHVDVLLTHDAPFGMRIIEEYAQSMRCKYDDASIANRKAVRAVVEGLTPTRHYHGHWHIRYSETLLHNGHRTQVTGLNRDGTGPRSWTVLDTAD